jgi:hypothetical protein
MYVSDSKMIDWLSQHCVGMGRSENNGLENTTLSLHFVNKEGTIIRVDGNGVTCHDALRGAVIKAIKTLENHNETDCKSMD